LAMFKFPSCARRNPANRMKRKLSNPDLKKKKQSQRLLNKNGYYPTNEACDGRLRKAQVEAPGHPEYVVHGRRSYHFMMEDRRSRIAIFCVNERRMA
jgi:hypothetical protein